MTQAASRRLRNNKEAMRLPLLLALLLGLPAGAQNVRVTPTLGAPAGVPSISLSGAATLAPLSPSGALAPATLSLTPTLAAPSIVPAPVALKAFDLNVAPAAAKPLLPGGVPDFAKTPLKAATPVDGWASRFNFVPDAAFFDQSREVRDQVGGKYAAVPKDSGKVRVHVLERAPLAAPKAVPGTEGLSGRALLDALNAISARGHVSRGYKETSDYIFSTADQVIVNGVRGVIDAYSGIFVPGTSKEGGDYPEPGDPNGDGYSDRQGMNIEHTWPQSLFNKASPERDDIHHLMATFMHPNSVRGSLPFGVVAGKPDYENKAGAKRGFNAAGVEVFEPPDAVKGLVARKQLYFYARHKNSRMFGRKAAEYWNGELETILRWNREFPPDAFEARRNDLGQAWQGNRNPFIDDYTLADRIGKDALRAGTPQRGGPGLRVSADRGGRPSRRR